MTSEARTPDDRPDLTAGMTPRQLAEAQQYGRLGLFCSLADKAIDVAFLATAAFLLARPLDDWLRGCPTLNDCWSLRLLVLYLVVFLLHLCVSFPLSCYSGHTLEHRFGLSKQTFGGWLWRYAKGNILAAVLIAAMVLGLYWLIWTTAGYWWLIAAGAFFVVSVLLGQLVPVLILPLFYKIERLDDADLAGRLERLSEGTGLSIEGVYRMDLSEETVKANAMLAGLGRTRRVLLGDTLLDHFTPDEIEVIFAHEIGHHVFGHIRKLIVAGIFSSLAGLFVCDQMLRISVSGWDGDYAEFPVYALPAIMLILTIFNMLLEPLQNAVSRHFERQSDRYALEQTGSREAYLSAFEKLAVLNKDDPDPPWLDVLLFHGHPPIAQRLAIADRET